MKVKVTNCKFKMYDAYDKIKPTREFDLSQEIVDNLIAKAKIEKEYMTIVLAEYIIQWFESRGFCQMKGGFKMFVPEEGLTAEIKINRTNIAAKAEITKRDSLFGCKRCPKTLATN